MTGLRAVALALALSMAVIGVAVAQSPPSPDVQRLSQALGALDADPVLAGKAALERYQAARG